ncbi:MAG TPA: WYL domain-containing protein [Gemmatimonadaceae bacterium]|nr:WYL domain-containing protein [Gemmatimonadaceae bacterium]
MATIQRVDRLDLLTRILRDRPGITVVQLARELGVSARSVFRDLDHLRDRGYPIEADRGRGGGLRLHASWGLGRVLLSSEEALCTLLSLAISEKLSFPMFSGDVARARKKIVDAFPSNERKKIAPLRERIFVGRPASVHVRGSYTSPAVTAMRRLQVAFVRETTVRADYVKENGESSTRRLEPHALLITWPAWYLLGFDHLRGEPRTFRFDRFRNVELEEGAPFRARPREIAARLLGDPCVTLEPV